MRLRAVFAPGFFALALVTARAYAVQIGDPDAPASVEIHAFASQGFILSKDNNFINVDSSKGSAQFSEVAVNFTKTLGDRLRFGLQLDANNFGPNGTYNVRADWFYADYRFADWFGVRFGRVKIPFGLYNEINDIDSARTFVLLPQSIYPQSDRDYLLAQTGGELYGYLRLGAAGALDYRAYAGTIFVDVPNQAGSAYQISSITTPFLFGGRLLWETPLEGLRIGGSLQTLRLDLNVHLANTQFDYQVPATLWVASAEYAAHDLLLAAEYSRWYLQENSSNPALLPSSGLMTSERAYALASYRVNRWLQPGAYYSLLFPDVDNRSGRANVQHDIATTLRFDINPYWIAKLEAHYMMGTAGLDSSINNNVPLSALTQDWGVFLAKTTVYF